MRDATRKIVSAALSADPSVPPSAVRDALALLDGRGPSRSLGRIVRVKEAARLCGVHPRSIRNWIDDGTLAPVRAPKTGRLKGVTEDSILALLEGRETEGGKA